MKPNFISVGATCAALGVALGAFGAHGLRDRVGAPELALWETATRYFVIGAFGVLLYGLFDRKSEHSDWPGWLLLVGSGLFAGSLYALALGAPRFLGLVTPFGGLGLIAGFLSFALAARRRG
ncbi:MAG TPA: DUF423 domain-containing protein [Polyangiaceae bacterium]|jgi:uncharacterized membrane protein YgdD (TMEM256/DUF423 family)|nr:DUF423 domain-containing protein [Polyangiaceae bacterium]